MIKHCSTVNDALQKQTCPYKDTAFKIKPWFIVLLPRCATQRAKSHSRHTRWRLFSGVNLANTTPAWLKAIGQYQCRANPPPPLLCDRIPHPPDTAKCTPPCKVLSLNHWYCPYGLEPGRCRISQDSTPLISSPSVSWMTSLPLSCTSVEAKNVNQGFDLESSCLYRDVCFFKSIIHCRNVFISSTSTLLAPRIARQALRV